MSSKFVVHHIFFEDDNSVAISVNGKQYKKRYRIIFFLMIQRQNTNLENIWFQQDGILSHMASETMEWLWTVFNVKLISRFSDVQRPAKSPDITHSDYFL